MSEETQDTTSEDCMHPYVHSSATYNNSQDLEAAQVPPIDEWIKRLQYIYRKEY